MRETSTCISGCKVEKDNIEKLFTELYTEFGKADLKSELTMIRLIVGYRAFHPLLLAPV